MDINEFISAFTEQFDDADSVEITAPAEYVTCFVAVLYVRLKYPSTRLVVSPSACGHA